ncbi:hypothetical protein RDABS01_002366 [Bienertia sinuspersici]
MFGMIGVKDIMPNLMTSTNLLEMAGQFL